MNDQEVVALRIARLNHACKPNAVTIYDETARVAILFAQRDISPGEEITICYYASFFGLVPVEQEINMNTQEEYMASLVQASATATTLPFWLSTKKDGRCIWSS